MDDSLTSAAGVRMPGILYGTAWKKDDTERLVRTAIHQGFRGLDTACQPKHYHEAGVGAAVAAGLSGSEASRGKLARADLYLQTKFTPLSGQDPARIPYDPKAPLAEQVEQSFGVSLRNLHTEYLDGLVLHSPLPSARQTLEAWRAMESLVDDLGIRAFCAQHGIVYQSFWTLTANPHVLAQRTVEELSSKYLRTPAQILLRYLTEIGVMPLTGTRSPAHMHDDPAIFEFDLDDAERRAMDALF